MITLRLSNHQMLLPVRVTPKGGRDRILPFSAGDTAIRLKVSAPPEDGKANAAVIRLLAAALDLPRNRLAIARGEKSRDKQVSIAFSGPTDADAVISRIQSVIQATRDDIQEMRQA